MTVLTCCVLGNGVCWFLWVGKQTGWTMWFLQLSDWSEFPGCDVGNRNPREPSELPDWRDRARCPCPERLKWPKFIGQSTGKWGVGQRKGSGDLRGPPSGFIWLWSAHDCGKLSKSRKGTTEKKQREVLWSSYEGGPKTSQNLFIKNCVFILTCLNFSHLESTLHLMQHTCRVGVFHCSKQVLNSQLDVFYVGSTHLVRFHRFTAGEEFCLRINWTSCLSHISFGWYLGDNLDFRLRADARMS